MCECCNELIALFNRYRESFGIDDPDDLGRVCQYPYEFCDVMCKHYGHMFMPDHCNQPEHDLCSRCGVLAVNAGFQRAPDWAESRGYRSIPIQPTSTVRVKYVRGEERKPLPYPLEDDSDALPD